MSETLEFEVSNDHSELERIAAEIEEFGEREGWPPALSFKINLALEEFVLNVITHGSHEELHGIKITLTADEEAVLVEIVDNGLAFDPLSDAPAPDLATPVENRQVGGLGIYLVREMVSDIQYARKDGQNVLSMKILKGE